MIINDLDGYYIVFDTKNWNTELDTLANWSGTVHLKWNHVMKKAAMAFIMVISLK